MYKIAIFSCDIFGGFKVMIDTNTCYLLNDIVLQAKEKLKVFLHHNSFEALEQKLNTMSFHIHNSTLEQILSSQEAIYICNHCTN